MVVPVVGVCVCVCVCGARVGGVGGGWEVDVLWGQFQSGKVTNDWDGGDGRTTL